MNPQPTPSNPRPAQGMGYLIVHATTARGAIPLEGVQILIRGYEPEFENARGDVIATLITDRDGNTQRISLAAPPKAASTSPGSPAPFAIYNLEARLEGYRGESFVALPIFDGITAVQPVDMIPLSENGTSAAQRPESDRFYETQAPSL